MSKYAMKVSVGNDKIQNLKRPLFPIDTECIVTGFRDDPNTEYRGYFRKLKNHPGCIFISGNMFRLADMDFPINIIIVETSLKWDFYY